MNRKMTATRRTKEEAESIETQKFCLLVQAICGVQERLDKIINLFSEKEKTKGRKRKA